MNMCDVENNQVYHNICISYDVKNERIKWRFSGARLIRSNLKCPMMEFFGPLLFSKLTVSSRQIHKAGP